MSTDDSYPVDYDTQRLGMYTKDTLGQMKRTKTKNGPAFEAYSDGSDAFANWSKAAIGFYHLPSDTTVHFKAFITSYSETFNSDWTEESVFGRADPIMQFKQTVRTLTVGWKIPAANLGEGYENLARVQAFLKMLYPYYNESNAAMTISQSPLIRMQFMNMITKTGTDSGNAVEMQTRPAKPGSFSASQASNALRAKKKATNMLKTFPVWNFNPKTKGLLGVVSNVSVNYNLESDEGGGFVGDSAIIPKLIDITIDFKVLHEQLMGWTAAGNDLGDSLYPYGVETLDEIAGATKGDKANIAKEIQSYTDDYRKQIEEEQKREAREADLANAQARYGSGPFQKLRAKKDLRQLIETGGKGMDPYRASAARGAIEHFQERGDKDIGQDLIMHSSDVAGDVDK